MKKRELLDRIEALEQRTAGGFIRQGRILSNLETVVLEEGGLTTRCRVNELDIKSIRARLKELMYNSLGTKT